MSENQRWRVVIADDHLLLRQGLRTLLDLSGVADVVGEAGDGAEALRLCRELKPSLLFLDLSMPVMSGMEALVQIKEEMPEIQVLILTVQEEGDTVLDAVRRGAAGYLAKSASVEDIRNAIRMLGSDGVYMSPSVTSQVLLTVGSRASAQAGTPAAADITSREHEVLVLLGEGLTARSIARRLGISERTVNTHVGNLYRRMGVTNRVDAVRTGMRIGIIAAPR